MKSSSSLSAQIIQKVNGEDPFISQMMKLKQDERDLFSQTWMSQLHSKQVEIHHSGYSK